MQFFYVAFILINFISFIMAYRKTGDGKAFGMTPYLFLLGSFVWGDALIFSLFWIIVSLISIVFQNTTIFLLFFATFWFIRSIGEAIYWFNEQFSVKHLNNVKNLPGYRFVKNEALYFIYQISMQCISVFSLVAMIYIIKNILG